GELPNFRKKSFFNKHKEFSIETKTKQKLKINIFACIQTDAFDSLLFNPIDVDISSKNEFLNHIKQKSVQYREILTTNESRFVALSTCEDMTTDGRIIVIGQIE
ncbi:TPA: FCT-2 pilus polymerization class B sortase SrtC1, partial [Streptococcus pyogenes]